LLASPSSTTILLLAASISMSPMRAWVTHPQAMVMGTEERFLSAARAAPAALSPPPLSCTPVLRSVWNFLWCTHVPHVVMPCGAYPLQCTLSAFLSTCRHPFHECKHCIFHPYCVMSADAAFPPYCTLYINHQTSFLALMYAYFVPCTPVCRCQRLVRGA
jgi:hypothetical protein